MKQVLMLACLVLAICLTVLCWPEISGFIGLIITGFIPVIVGFAFAYILNIPMHFIERQFDRRELGRGTHAIGSRRGYSSHQYNPFVILCDHDATEDTGCCFGASVCEHESARSAAHIANIVFFISCLITFQQRLHG
jgi:hypothetical protein